MNIDVTITTTNNQQLTGKYNIENHNIIYNKENKQFITNINNCPSSIKTIEITQLERIENEY